MLPLLIPLTFLGVILALIGGTRFVNRIYKRVPPSQAMVIFGWRKTRYVTGTGTLVSPLFEQFQMLDLTIKTIQKDADELYTIDGVPILLDWVSQVQVDFSEAGLETAARAFLGRTQDEIKAVITETLSANFRAIVGRMTVEEIHRDRDAFVMTVQELASDDMGAMGILIISMGIEEITDNKGYFEAMAAPQIAAVKRDARIAEAEADREARVKAARAKRDAEQAELDSEREILQEKQALELRQVEMEKMVGLERAKSQQTVEKERALAVEQQQEAEVLVPARAKRQATEIEADADRKRTVIVAEAEAEAARRRAEVQAEMIKRKAKAEAEATENTGRAEAEKLRAALLAEAEGRSELARATAAEGEINLRQFIIETLAQADVDKTAHIAAALAGVGENVKIVQFGGDHNGGQTGVTLLDMLLNVPEMAAMLNAKVEALSGSGLDEQLGRALKVLGQTRVVETNGAHVEHGHAEEEVVEEDQAA